MTRLFGCISNQPERTAHALRPLRDVLVADAPVPRWGLGYVQSGQVLLARHPRMVEDQVDLYAGLEERKTDYAIAWAAGDDGLRSNGNTQPFRFRAWFYAQSAASKECALGHAELLEHLPGFLQRNIRGKSLAEQVFHVFLSMLHDAGKLSDPNLDVVVIREALRDTAALVAKVAKVDAEKAIGNAIVSNSRSMVAARWAEPLWVRHLKETDPDVLETEQYRAVLVVARDEAPGEGFEEVPKDHGAAITRQVKTSIVPLI